MKKLLALAMIFCLAFGIVGCGGGGGSCTGCVFAFVGTYQYIFMSILYLMRLS